MNQTEYVRLYRADVRYRVRYEVERGRVIEFVVQLEAWSGSDWVPVVRYDTAHGFAHRDRYNAKGIVSRHELLPVSDFNAAFTFASREVRNSWQELIDEFWGQTS